MFHFIITLLLGFIFLAASSIYFIPTFIALIRKHHNTKPIFVVNLFFGFSLIGWVVALAWSLTKVPATHIQ